MTDPVPDPELLERRVQAAWLQAQGLTRAPLDTIHPDDEMYSWEGQAGTARTSLRAVYLRTGHEALCVLENVLAAAGKRLEQVESLLDFACGYGRLTRFLCERLGPERVWASDVLLPAVDFVRATFGVQAFPSATDPARLELPRRFEVIWVGSLFSHLPRARFAEFLTALAGALEPGGLLIFSTHGAQVVPEVPKDPSGFTFVTESESAVLDPEEYGATFVTPAIVRSIAAECGFPHLAWVERDLWRVQDVFALSDREHPGLAAWRNTPLARGAVTHASVERRASRPWARVEGWVRVRAQDHPLRGVRLVLDREREIAAETAELPDVLDAADGGAGFRQTDWRVAGDAGELAPGPHTVAVVATDAAGRERCVWALALDVPD